jgi:hypothetical protein
MKPTRPVLIAGLVLAMSGMVGAQDVPAEQFVIVPLRVHVLTSPNIEMVNCQLNDAGVARVVGELNAIWHKGGIHFGVESVRREPAEQTERFRLTAGLKDGEVGVDDLRMLLPRGSRGFAGVHIYFFHELPFNSVYLIDDLVLSQELAQVEPVPGGSKDPVARVTAHALGNLLALPNIKEPRNLMGGGTSGTALTETQAETARKFAKTIAGAMTVDGLRKAVKAAETKGDAATLKRLRSWLAEIPGAGAAETKRR